MLYVLVNQFIVELILLYKDTVITAKPYSHYVSETLNFVVVVVFLYVVKESIVCNFSITLASPFHYVIPPIIHDKSDNEIIHY